MDKEQVLELLSVQIKNIRLENHLSMDKMAEILGTPKKKIIQIEKGKSMVLWRHVIIICAIFPESPIIASILGDEPLSTIQSLTYEAPYQPKNKTYGGRIWWRNVKVLGRYRMQQHFISRHFRIVDDEQDRWYSTFDEEEAILRLNELYKGSSIY